MSELPAMTMPTSTLSMSAVATRSSRGGRAPSNVTSPRSKRKRRPARPNVPRIIRTWPTSSSVVVVPRARRLAVAPFGFHAHAGDVDAVVGAKLDVELPDARHAGVGALRIGIGQRLAAPAHAGELRHFGGRLPDDLVADLAEIERAPDPGALAIVGDPQIAGRGGAEIVAAREPGILEVEPAGRSDSRRRWRGRSCRCR